MADTLPDPDLEALAEVMRTFGHDTRLRLVATLLAPGRYVIHNVPRITDVTDMSELLRAMAVSVEQRGTDRYVADRDRALAYGVSPPLQYASGRCAPGMAGP